MEDNRLKAFCLVVEMKSFSKAADATLVTQSAMSHLIKNLEDESGVKLLNRAGRKVIPTAAGWTFYGHAKKILDSYKSMAEEICGLMNDIRGPLNLGASTGVAKYLLPQALYDFAKLYPEVQLNLKVSDTESILNDLQHGDIEVGIVEGDIDGGGISSEVIADDEIVLIASDENPLAGKGNITREDFLSQHFIMHQTGSGVREVIEDFLLSSGIDTKEMKVSMTIGDPELIVRLVQSDLGIAFVSRWSVVRALKEGTIAILRMPGRGLHRKFFLTSLYEEPFTMVGKTFHCFVREYRFFVPFQQ